MAMTVTITKKADESLTALIDTILRDVAIGESVVCSTVEREMLNHGKGYSTNTVSVILKLLTEQGYFAATYAETRERAGVCRVYTRIK